MIGQRYQLGSATLAIHSENGIRTPITVPAGSIVTVLGGPLDGNRMVDVDWDGRTMMMFTVDVRERGTRVGE